MYWPPFYGLENNAASFDPAYYSIANQAVVDRTTGQIVSGPRYNGIVLPGDGFPSSASNLPEYNDPVVNSLFVGVPRGFAETHKNVFEPTARDVLRRGSEDHREGERRHVPHSA